MTPTEELRAAAKAVRRRADGAPLGRWELRECGDSETKTWIAMDVVRARHGRNALSFDEDGALGEHVVSWCPAAALAVAEWLESEAERFDEAKAAGFPSALSITTTVRALGFARLYLGGGA